MRGPVVNGESHRVIVPVLYCFLLADGNGVCRTGARQVQRRTPAARYRGDVVRHCVTPAPARYRGGRPPPGTEATLCNTGACRQVQRRQAPAARYRGDGLPSPCDREGNNGIRRDEDDEGAWDRSGMMTLMLKMGRCTRTLKRSL